MVTKPVFQSPVFRLRLILAKIHMVTKPQNHYIIDFDIS